jgi:hypothetical protein
MNERIRQLAEQCTSWSEGSTWTSHEEFDKEKFAELIVQECAEQVKNLRVNGYGISGAEIIRKHFRS